MGFLHHSEHFRYLIYYKIYWIFSQVISRFILNNALNFIRQYLKNEQLIIIESLFK
jgi:hypothetical protein